MPDRLLLDTNLLIDFLRERADAVQYMQGLTDRPFISAVVVAELYVGIRDGDERARLERLISGFRVVPLTRQMAIEGGLYVRQFGKSHGTGLADALIAATAQTIGATLVTLNSRHFPMLTKIQRPY